MQPTIHSITNAQIDAVASARPDLAVICAHAKIQRVGGLFGKPKVQGELRRIINAWKKLVTPSGEG